MKAMVTGAGGQLGRELARTAPSTVELHAFSRQELDLLDARALDEMIETLCPDLVVNAAGYTAVDLAEADRARAFAVNAESVGRLAAAASDCGARLIQVSSDYVFAGDRQVPYAPEDEPSPRSVYGKSKRQGEVLALEASGGEALILRTSWLYSQFGRNFVKTMLVRLGKEALVQVVGDQLGSPTWAKGAAEAIWRAAERPELKGLIHWSDAGVVSWYDFAMAIRTEATSLGLLRGAARIEAIRTEDLRRAARRPPFSALDCRSSSVALGLTPCPWRQALSQMLAELLEAASA